MFPGRYDASLRLESAGPSIGSAVSLPLLLIRTGCGGSTTPVAGSTGTYLLSVPRNPHAPCSTLTSISTRGSCTGHSQGLRFENRIRTTITAPVIRKVGCYLPACMKGYGCVLSREETPASVSNSPIVIPTGVSPSAHSLATSPSLLNRRVCGLVIEPGHPGAVAENMKLNAARSGLSYNRYAL